MTRFSKYQAWDSSVIFDEFIALMEKIDTASYDELASAGRMFGDYDTDRVEEYKVTTAMWELILSILDRRT